MLAKNAPHGSCYLPDDSGANLHELGQLWSAQRWLLLPALGLGQHVLEDGAHLQLRLVPTLPRNIHNQKTHEQGYRGAWPKMTVLRVLNMYEEKKKCSVASVVWRFFFTDSDFPDKIRIRSQTQEKSLIRIRKKPWSERLLASPRAASHTPSGRLV